MKSETMELHKKKAPIKVSCGVITLSDRFSNDKEGEDKDLSGKYLKEELGKKYDVDAYAIIPDEMDTLRNTIEEMIDNGIEVIITTGGTGLESRDITIETILFTGLQIMFSFHMDLCVCVCVVLCSFIACLGLYNHHHCSIITRQFPEMGGWHHRLDGPKFG